MNALEFENTCDRLTDSVAEGVLLTDSLKAASSARHNCLTRLHAVLMKWGSSTDGNTAE
jgi:hypothetical protein